MALTLCACVKRVPPPPLEEAWQSGKCAARAVRTETGCFVTSGWIDESIPTSAALDGATACGQTVNACDRDYTCDCAR
ncbi:MAG: hypothetical protein ACO1OB_22115 [Archangium sp.]